MGQSERVREVVIPTEKVVETKDGQKVQTEKRTLPGYVLVNMGRVGRVEGDPVLGVMVPWIYAEALEVLKELPALR